MFLARRLALASAAVRWALALLPDVTVWVDPGSLSGIRWRRLAASAHVVADAICEEGTIRAAVSDRLRVAYFRLRLHAAEWVRHRATFDLGHRADERMAA